jgi:hypothetical protein
MLTVPQDILQQFKFRVGEVVQHVKTKGVYHIAGTPDHFRLESSNEPAYAYRGEHDNFCWVRSQTEMEEEGRFVRLSSRPEDVFPTINGIPAVQVDPIPTPVTPEV